VEGHKAAVGALPQHAALIAGPELGRFLRLLIGVIVLPCESNRWEIGGHSALNWAHLIDFHDLITIAGFSCRVFWIFFVSAHRWVELRTCEAHLLGVPQNLVLFFVITVAVAGLQEFTSLAFVDRLAQGCWLAEHHIFSFQNRLLS